MDKLIEKLDALAQKLGMDAKFLGSEAVKAQKITGLLGVILYAGLLILVGVISWRVFGFLFDAAKAIEPSRYNDGERAVLYLGAGLVIAIGVAAGGGLAQAAAAHFVRFTEPVGSLVRDLFNVD